MKLSKKKAIELFRKHWGYLYEINGNDKDKIEWLYDNRWTKGWEKGWETILNHCFLCEYASNKMREKEGWILNKEYCKYCPVEFPLVGEYGRDCFSHDSLYHKWANELNKSKREEYCRQILEAPVRKRVRV